MSLWKELYEVRTKKDDRLYKFVNKVAEGINNTISAAGRFRTFITFQADYLTKPKDGKGAFIVTLQPGPDKYYILGADNIFNKKWLGGYVGMGVRFEDEDFKYLLGTIPRISTQ